MYKAENLLGNKKKIYYIFNKLNNMNKHKI